MIVQSKLLMGLFVIDWLMGISARLKPFDLPNGWALFGGKDVQPELARFDGGKGGFKVSVQSCAGQESLPSGAVTVLQLVVLYPACVGFVDPNTMNRLGTTEINGNPCLRCLVVGGPARVGVAIEGELRAVL